MESSSKRARKKNLHLILEIDSNHIPTLSLFETLLQHGMA